MTTHTIHTHGGTVTAKVVDSDDGPLLVLGSDDFALEGIAPGEYLLVQADAEADEAHAAVNRGRQSDHPEDHPDHP